MHNLNLNNSFSIAKVPYLDKYDNFKDKIVYVEDSELIQSFGIIEKEILEQKEILTNLINQRIIENSKNTLDLQSLKIEKLLGGGQTNTAYTIKVKNATPSAIEKVKQAGGDVILPIQKTEEKTEDVENNNG